MQLTRMGATSRASPRAAPATPAVTPAVRDQPGPDFAALTPVVQVMDSVT
jgi:hypothetical protein